MKFRTGGRVATIDRYGFIRVGNAGFHYESAANHVKLAVKQAIKANQNHPDADNIINAIKRTEK